MTRLVYVIAMLTLMIPGAAAQTASSSTHTVGPGDSLYGIVAIHYPERMARWTDVAADLVALNPDAFPEGLDTVLRLGDELVLVDYSSAGNETASSAPASRGTPPSTSDAGRQNTGAEPAPRSIAEDASSSAAVSATPEPRENPESEAPDTSESVIGVVVRIDGRALATNHQNQQRALAIEDRIYFGDAVSTDETSSVLVRMLDDAEFNVQPASRLMFERYQFDPDTQRGGAVVTLVKGGFRGTSGLLGQNFADDITVNTAVSTVSVRGTEFALRVCARNTCRATASGDALKPGLYSGVLEGQIVLSNNTGDVENNRGEFFHVAAPNTVPEAAPNAALLLFTRQELARLNVEVEEEQPLSFLGWLKRKLFGQ